VADKLKLPQSIKVDINAQSIKLHFKKDARPDYIEKQNLIFLYLSAHYPEPVRLYTRLLSTQVDENTMDYSLAFENCAEDIKEALEKYIFKIHRRDISSLRKRTT